MTAETIEAYEGSANIFEELGLPDAGTHLLKAQIVSEVYRLSNSQKLTQAKTGSLLGITQPEVSRMFKGNFREYSVERLMGFLTAFDQDVEIVAKARRSGSLRGSITFRHAAE
jgi:predicted XRE-type DNA-binding protein